MKIILIALSLMLVVIAVPDEEEWQTFKIQHEKLYANRSAEIEHYNIFKKNLQMIREHNKKFENDQSSFEMGVNQFTDMTPKELQQFLGYKPSTKLEGTTGFQYFKSDKNLNVPETLNWTALGAVTSVKNQGQCRSCWSFGVVGSVEGQYFLKTSELVSLSAQNLIDCDKTSFGCDGGVVVHAFKYIIENGIQNEELYPYYAINQACKANSSTAFLKIRSFEKIPEGDENELMRAVASIGPLTAGVHANQEFYTYKSGILEDPLCEEENTAVNHNVLVVGYGNENGKDYWLIKNSWGPDWGASGYAKMLRNYNMCKIATEVFYPVL